MTPLLLALALLAADAAPAARSAYVSAFCAPLALGEADPAAVRRLYAEWDAKPGSDVDAEAFQPQDTEITGQMVVFARPEAPRAFVERRRGGCALVFSGARASKTLLDDFAASTVKVGRPAPARWRRLSSRKAGPPGPIRYFLPVGEDGRFGVCASVYEDLRLRDAAPATLVRVATCRLSGDEVFDNG